MSRHAWWSGILVGLVMSVVVPNLAEARVRRLSPTKQQTPQASVVFETGAARVVEASRTAPGLTFEAIRQIVENQNHEAGRAL